jgi:acetyl esterase/lipase
LRFQDEVFPAVTVERDIRYGRALGLGNAPEALTLDLYQPAGDEVPSRPALLWVHGGGFAFGTKTDEVASDAARTFARRGYVTVSINYRLLAPEGCEASGGASAACTAAALSAGEDAKAAVRWVRSVASRYRIDPKRVAIAGESAGGILAAGLGAREEEPGNSGNPGYSSRVQAWMSLSGGLPDGLFVTPGDSPGLLIHGTADDIVPYDTFAAATASALRRAGVPVELVTLNGAGHVPWEQYRELILQRTSAFFYRYLRLDAIGGFGG